MDPEARLRKAIFQWYVCSPGQLERVIRKGLGCKSLRFKMVLGRGTFNLVLDADMDDQQRVAIRLPDPRVRLYATRFANSNAGYGATLFLSQLHLPVFTARLVEAPLPYRPPGKSHFMIMEVAPGMPLHKIWNEETSVGLPLEVKKRVLADLAAVAAELYRHPFPALGDMAVSADGGACVAKLSTGTVAAAIRRGIDVGQLSPGPYATWKEYARNQLEGLKLLSGAFCPRYWLDSVQHNLDILLRWLEGFNPPPERNDRFYLHHPDIRESQVMVDPCSGRIESILDWDGATTGEIRYLGELFSLVDPLMNCGDEADVLHGFYCAELEQRGAFELVSYVKKQSSGDEDSQSPDPQLMFDKGIGVTEGFYGVDLHMKVGSLCLRMQELGFISGAEKVANECQVFGPWLRRRCRRKSRSKKTRGGMIRRLLRFLKRVTGNKLLRFRSTKKQLN